MKPEGGAGDGEAQVEHGTGIAGGGARLRADLGRSSISARQASSVPSRLSLANTGEIVDPIASAVSLSVWPS